MTALSVADIISTMTAKPKTASCPYCDHPMRTRSMRCDSCGVTVTGEFAETLFSRLNADDLDFLEEYTLAGFSIKALAESSGRGYAAIRSRLDRIIERCRELRGRETEKREILARLAAGNITAGEAARLIEDISRQDDLKE